MEVLSQGKQEFQISKAAIQNMSELKADFQVWHDFWQLKAL